MAEYYIGLDIGTESVGWAVTDTEYNVLKKNGKALWGVRLFSEAQKAVERRGFRTARRRLERRNQRIEWVRRIFNAEIAKVDPAFFMRLDESKFLEQDKRTLNNGQALGRYTLFADKDYCDKDYHKEFPTIYHLRKALMFEDRAFDVRLVYLAVHHIMKKRGHFLFSDVNIDDVTFDHCMDNLREYLQNEYDVSFNIHDPEQFARVLSDRSLNITRKKAALRMAAGVDKQDAQLCAIIDLLAGAKVKPSALCAIALANEDDESFSFKESFENKEAKLCDILGDDMQLIYLAKGIYDWALLDELRKGASCISCAKVQTYEEHERDLQRLKKLLRADAADFKEMFRIAGSKLDNYPAYSGHGSANYRCDYAKFAAYARKKIKAILPRLNAAAQAEANEILNGLELGTFLPKQTSKDNGVLPHQLHEYELKIILDRASAYLPFLNERDESGLSKKEQLLALFRFRVPYYVGPLYKIRDPEKAKGQNCWVVRGDERITPWNFEEVVDVAACAENFITRMTATCSYIGEPVLPRDSLLYSKFVALNTINKIQVNGHGISVETKQRIFNDHLLIAGKSNFRALKNFMLSNGLMQKGDEISGVDEQFKLTLTGYQVFRKLLARENSYFMVEDIIRHCVLFGEDRKLLERWLKDNYGAALSVEDREYIIRSRGRFRGWGSLSEDFLTRIDHVDGHTGEAFSIMDMLWDTNHNLMELLSGAFTFAESIKEFREAKYGGKRRTLEDILDESYASPGIRRSIRQAMGIIAEIEKIMQGQPQRVFVEVTRGEGVKERIPSRKRRLEELYASCKKEAPEIYAQLQGFEEPELRSAKLYLYFTQLGKCMYSGAPIDLSRLSVDYDIDHIHPQSVVKDDSLNNRVLVRRELNAAKSDKYPLSEEIRKNMAGFWKHLRAKNLISEEKYRRLIRNTQFSDAERSGFIARQLVETSQSSKLIAELLKDRYADDRVVYVKAGNVSAFRQDQRILEDGTQRQAWKCKDIHTRQDPLFVKCREVNDFHHAKDAYLNIVVGNVYDAKFSRNPLNFIKSGQTYSMNRVFDMDVVRGGSYAWKKGEDGSIATVRKTMRKNNILFTRFAYEAKGRLFEQTILRKDNYDGKSRKAMIKSNDPRMTVNNYGGYDGLTTAYFALIEHTDKKKRVRSIETVYLMDKALYERDPVAYCEVVLKLKNPKVLISKIKIDSLLSYDGFRMHVSGRSDVRISYKNANQLIISAEEICYIKQIFKFVARKKENAGTKITAFDGITLAKNQAIFSMLLKKLCNERYGKRFMAEGDKLNKGICKFEKMTLEDQCDTLATLINVFNTKSATVDLSNVGGSKKAGDLRMSKNLSGFAGHSFKLIHQSITGFFEQEVDLLGDEF